MRSYTSDTPVTSISFAYARTIQRTIFIRDSLIPRRFAARPSRLVMAFSLSEARSGDVDGEAYVGRRDLFYSVARLYKDRGSDRGELNSVRRDASGKTLEGGRNTRYSVVR